MYANLCVCANIGTTSRGLITYKLLDSYHTEIMVFKNNKTIFKN